jgi:hypothetical protein
MINLQSLAALAVRLLGLALLLFTLPQLVQLATAVVLSMSMSDPHASTAMVWSLAWFLLVPIVAVVLVLYARPIGRLIARGIE